MRNNKSGVYQIKCIITDKIYIGSSKQIYTRWSQHRTYLRRNKSTCLYLQYAWNKHGESTFYFSILEECSPELLEKREQYWVNKLNPALNCLTEIERRWGEEQRKKIAAKTRARSDALTHCPNGHPYDEKNTYKSRRSRHICRICNTERVGRIIADETPKQRKARLKRNNDNYYKNHEHNRAIQAEYVKEHKAEKQEYDRNRRAIANEQRNRRRANETPERREERLRKKRESYHRYLGRLQNEKNI